MGYNRTVCMLSVTSADICLNSHLGVNGVIGLNSLEDVGGFRGICGSVSGVREVKNEKANTTG